MECNDVQKKIEPFLKGELRPVETSQFITHIENCSECREELEVRFLISIAMSSSTNEDGDIDYDLSGLLKKRIEKEKKHLEQLNLLVVMITVAAVLLIAAALIYYFYFL